MKKMRMIAAAGGLFLGSMLLSGCEAKVTAQVPEVIQIQNVDKSQDGKITLSSSETVEIVPDMAEIVFCVTTQHEQAGECQQENTRKLNELLEFLKGQGFDEKKIKTSGFSLDTRYDWSGDKQQIIGYEMRTQVAVTDIPADSVGMVLSKGVESGANEIYSVSWFSSEYDKPVQGAEEKALYRMPVLVNTETTAVTRVLGAEKDKDTQRQASAVSGQIGHNAVTEFFMPEAFAAEKYKQADEVHRQSPGELKNIE